MALVLRVLAILCCVSFAKDVEKINFADQIEFGAQKLVLNGAGLRTKRKIGINFRVYVGGLYLVKKADDAKTIIASDNPKVLRMVFLRSLDADTLREAWEEGFSKNCKPKCDKLKNEIKAFNELMVPVKENSELKVTFEKDSVKVEMSGKESKSGKVDGAEFSKAMLAVFIGDEPPTPEFKAALLGK